MTAVGNDVSDRRDSALIGAMVESAVDGIIVIDDQAIVRMINSAAERLFSYSSQEIIGRNVNTLMPEPYRSQHDGYVENYLQTGVRKIIGIGREVIGRRKDGSTFPMYLSVGEVSLGEYRLFTGIVQDLTERKLAEEQIARLQYRQELILKSVEDGIIGFDKDSRVSFANPAAIKMLGLQNVPVVGSAINEIWRLSDECPLLRVLEEGVSCHDKSCSLISRSGTEFSIEYSMTPIREAGQVVGAVLSLRDVSERRRAAQEVQRMRTYLKNIIDSMPSALIGVDKEGRVLEWNHGAEQTSGISQRDAQGKLFSQVLPYLDSQLHRVQESIRKRTSMRSERVVFESEGQPHYADVMVYPLVANGTLGAVIRVDDVTNRVRIEQMMVQTEKMLSVGGLAAGMAHEINNPLSAVLQGCQNIQRRLSSDLVTNKEVAEKLGLEFEKIRDYLQERGIFRFLDGIQEAGRRATGIVNDMLAFSRRSKAELAPVRVHEMLEVVIRLAGSDYDLKKNYDFRQINIVRDYDSNLDWIYCDRTEIEQVLLNLVKNAAQAMSSDMASKPLCITLRTRKIEGYACIEVEDTGPGMDEATKRRVFEPFFTTKVAGVGTGLGLSVSYFIITEQHQGDIQVSSSPGQGTCFTIRLPIGQRRESKP